MSTGKLPLSVAVVTLNEERNLPRCLESVKDLAAEIVVVDSGSTDKTVEIAEAHGAKVFHNPWPGFREQRNIAHRYCTHEWVLALDADEWLTPELAKAIRGRLSNDGSGKPDGYQLNRRNFYLGDWIWHAWYPEWRLRLTRRDKSRWTGLDLHGYMEVDGLEERIREGDLLHYSYRDLEHHFQVTIKYAKSGAQDYLGAGRGFRWYKLLFSPTGRFLKTLILKQAWRDGWRGVIISYSSAMSVFAKYAFLLEERLKNQQAEKRR